MRKVRKEVGKMLNKKWMSILVLVFAFVFLSTAGYAKSGSSYSNKYSKSWWYSPFYQLKKAAKEVQALKKKILRLERKTNRLEKKKENLEEQITSLDAEIKNLHERQVELNSVAPQKSIVDNENKPNPFVCPGCNFSDSTEFAGYDFSNAFLGHMTAQNADMSYANFTNAKVRFAYIWDSSLQHADFTDADFFGATLCADFTGACFKDANLGDAVWTNDWYGKATCPNGTTLELTGESCLEHLDIEVYCPSDPQ
jgi:hypothetical protein